MEMLGELSSYVEVTRSAILLSEEHAFDRGDGVIFPDGRPMHPMRSLLAVWYPRVREILMLIGSHNLLATPSKAMLADARLRPLIDEFVHGANDVDAERRAGIYRLAWDFIGSGLGLTQRVVRAQLPGVGEDQPHAPHAAVLRPRGGLRAGRRDAAT